MEQISSLDTANVDQMSNCMFEIHLERENGDTFTAYIMDPANNNYLSVWVFSYSESDKNRKLGNFFDTIGTWGRFCLAPGG